MKPTNDPARYRAYLLRLWRIGESEPTMWRVSIEDPRTGQRRDFPDLESLFVFLEEPIGRAVDHHDDQLNQP